MASRLAEEETEDSMWPARVILLLPTSNQLVVSLSNWKSPVQSPSSSKSSQSVPGIKLSNKSDWHSLGSFLLQISPFGRWQCWPAAAHNLGRMAILMRVHLENRTGFWRYDWFHQMQWLGRYAPEAGVSGPCTPGTDVRNACLKRTQVSAAASVGNM